MRLERIVLANFRNFSSLEYQASSGLNLFLGANAQGKTNLLEALAMLGTGKSFRTTSEGELIRHEIPVASVSGEARVRAGTVSVSCVIAKGPRGITKRYTLNGSAVRYAGYLGNLRVVAFVPSDLSLVDGPPSGRRRFLNEALAQDDPTYYHALARYRKTLAQKAALLRGSVTSDEELLAIYDAALIEHGTKLMMARAQFVRDVARYAGEVHARWTGGAERLEVRYRPDAACEVITADAIGSALAERLRSRAAAERLREAPLVGPQRDDLDLLLDGSSLGSFGSQGQRRTAVLALKVAEYQVMRDRCGEAPLLLLDDVLSELDATRAGAFLSGLGEIEQGFITATSLPPGIGPMRSIEIVAGQLRENG